VNSNNYTNFTGIESIFLLKQLPDMEFLENDLIKITVNPKGAELTTLYDKTSDTEYMWSGDAAFWGKHSPVLFPVVGTLKEDHYFYEGKKYELGRHGFARDRIFTVNNEQKDRLIFSLDSDENSLQQFPFLFRLEIIYQLQQKKLSVSYHIVNTGKAPLYFSVGGHPAFKLPIDSNTAYDDYYLEFEDAENAGRWPISKDGLIESNPIPFLDGKKLALTKSLFHKDALVFKQLKSSSVQLKSTKTSKGFQFNFPGFPYLGIWAAKDADFVCIEPWCGIADGVNTSQEFTEKEGINHLAPDASFVRSWSVEIFA
jgi:galactose mutarotase-like enzyme